MAIDKAQLREFIRAVLQEVELYSPEAEELLMMTAATESNLGTYIRQKGGGPAIGVWQMEPRTYKDIIENYLKFNPILRKKVEAVVGDLSLKNKLRNDLAVQVIFARLLYLRVPGQLPSSPKEMAEFYKKYYNTPKGAAKVEEVIGKYNQYVVN